jgi:hypothetical protein
MHTMPCGQGVGLHFGLHSSPRKVTPPFTEQALADDAQSPSLQRTFLLSPELGNGQYFMNLPLTLFGAFAPGFKQSYLSSQETPVILLVHHVGLHCPAFGTDSSIFLYNTALLPSL